MVLIGIMKRLSLRKTPAPTPRLTLWVPVIAGAALSLSWLVLVAVLHR
jgi:hypothetical protein